MLYTHTYVQGEGFMRLDKYLTQAGFGTRSQVKQSIRKGQVQVDGETETRADRKIDEERATVTCQGRAVRFQRTVYYMMNKPAGCVCATRDGRERTVMDLLAQEQTKDLFPVGRLDKDAEGLLLLTNDGALAHRLLSPGRHVPKTYLAVLEKDMTPEQVTALESGVDIGEKKMTRPSVFCWKDREKREALLTITEGKFHQVKRMFAAVENKVLYLRRVRMGSLLLDETLGPGQYRLLSTEEAEELLHYVTR